MALLEMIQSYLDKPSSLIERFKNKDMVLYLGLAKSGKGTLINCLIETALKAEHIRSITYNLAKVNDSDPGPVIRRRPLSSTHISELYWCNDTFIIDDPGFFDNRVNQEIIAFYLKQVRHAKTCKFVLVIDINEFVKSNKDLFLMSLNNLVSLVKGDLSGSLSLVFTNAESVDNHDSILILLRDIIEQEQLNITPEVRSLIRSIVKRPESTSFFRMPTQEGLVANIELVEGHDQAVRASQPLNVQNVKFNASISPNMLLEVSKLFSTYCDIIDFSILSEFPMKFEKYFHFGVVETCFASTDDELDQAEEKACTFEAKVMVEKQKRFTTIKDVVTSFHTFSSPIASYDFFRNVQVFTEIENLPSAKVMVEKYKTCLNSWHKDIKRLIEAIKKEKTYRSDRDFKFVIENGVIGVSVVASILGTLGLRAATAEAITAAILAASATAAAAATATAAAAATAIPEGKALKRSLYNSAVVTPVGIYNAFNKYAEIEQRMYQRERQGRPACSLQIIAAALRKLDNAQF